ncbi:MAG: inorganic phosphate transporter [Oligoflexia bacterium]|nr:inorganic phosphate transporter [Oligoflexia bacterium]
MALYMLITVIVFALIFEYINGFHDAANAVATIISTKVLTPKAAIIFAAFFNFIGAFSGTHVAKTIGSGIVDANAVTQVVILSALCGAIVWNLFTWFYGLPSSSSHALIGGLLGPSIADKGITAVNLNGLYSKVIMPMITSPLLGFVMGFLIMLSLLWIFFNFRPDTVNKYFRKLQLISAAFMAFGHGSNDAQKTMGIITLSLLSFHYLESFEVPVIVISACALTMGLGTMFGGWRIIRTMGSKVMKMKPIHGFAAQTAASSIIIAASHFGIPVSTTHVITTSIMGVGSTHRISAVKWGLVGNIIWAWILTIPICATISTLFFYLINPFLGHL